MRLSLVENELNVSYEKISSFNTRTQIVENRLIFANSSIQNMNNEINNIQTLSIPSMKESIVNCNDHITSLETKLGTLFESTIPSIQERLSVIENTLSSQNK